MTKKQHEYTIGHLFSGIGGGAYGAAQARVAIGDHEATFRTLGGVDVDLGSCEDFEYLCDAPATVADIHTMSVEQLREAWGDTAPDMVLLSPPCKGFSGLLSRKLAATEKYQVLNRLVLDGLFLVSAAWEKPPALIFVENVPRITAATRGKDLLQKTRQLLRAYGYAVTADDYHDCGEIGGLAQHRKRFFLVARDPERVPAFVYQPGKNRVKACGEVIEPLPTPGDTDAGGPMHRLPKISWLNWIRLALIPAGGDWRDLPGVIPEGKTRREIHRRHHVADWDKPVATVAGSGSNGVNNVSDPRIMGDAFGLKQTAKGADSYKGRPGLFGVNDWDSPLPTVTGSMTISGSNAVAAVADPRLGHKARNGAYGVLSWEQAAGTVTGGCHDNSRVSIADPRTKGPKGSRSANVDDLGELADGIPEDPRKPPEFIPVIIAADGAWHRPLTVLELAALQGFPTTHKGEPFALSGGSSTAWRERIGNAIPPPAAKAVASEMLLALLSSEIDMRQQRLEAIWVEGLDDEPVYASEFLAALEAAGGIR